MNWIEKWLAPFRVGMTSSTTMQSLGEIEQRTPAVGAKIWCLHVCFLSRSEASVLFVRGGILWAGFVSLFMGRYWWSFQRLFRRDCPFRWAR